MKAKDLIDYLSKLDPNTEVAIQSNAGYDGMYVSHHEILPQTDNPAFYGVVLHKGQGIEYKNETGESK
jgi:hypothetical protein